MNDLLIIGRAVHFASCALLAGTLIFGACVAGPALRRMHANAQLAAWYRRSVLSAWICVVLAVLSGAAWLVIVAADISGQPLAEVLTGDIVWRVLRHTRFGIDWGARLVLALLLAGGLYVLARHRDATPRRLHSILATLAVLFVGSLAWSGHASGTPGLAGSVHIAVDALHLVAVAAWVGGLVPLALLLAAARRAGGPTVASVAREATLRFSTLGVIAVGTVLATGLINTYVLVGSVSALIATGYGNLLLAKMGLFAVMVCVAAFNRLRLVPRLSSTRTGGAHRQLQRNSLFEAAMGLLILAIVGALGTLPPGMHGMPTPSVHEH